VTIDQKNIVICPSCGSENIEGSDSCSNCMMDLSSIDVPSTYQVLPESDLNIPISAVRKSRPRTVGPMQTVREAIAEMKANSVGVVVIMDGSKVAGIFTDRDVLKKAALDPSVMSEPVAHYMTPDPVVLRDDDTMAMALNKMGDGGFRHIPIVKSGELVGIITARDVMSWVLGKYFD
jgi:CBS domain-containing protein